MIDEAAGAEWPEEVRASAERFLQGDLVENPPFFYVADLRTPVWGLSQAVATDTPVDERAEDLLELEEEQRPPYGIITTQSCDLAEEDRDPRNPWIAVAPVYSVSDDSSILPRDEIYRLTPPTLAEKVVWVDWTPFIGPPAVRAGGWLVPAG